MITVESLLADIKKRRIEAGYSLRKFAKPLGVHFSQYRLIENGKYNLKVAMLLKIQKMLKVKYICKP